MILLSSNMGQWRKKLENDSINITQEDSFENCDWIYVYVDGSALNKIVSLVYFFCETTSSGASNQFEDFNFKNNGSLVPFNDCR